MSTKTEVIERKRRAASQWAVAWRRFKKNKVALLGLFIIGTYAFIGVFSPYLARYEPASVQPIFEGEAGEPPSWKHPFGTTSEGRDVFSDVIHGTRNMFYVGLGATGISVVFAILFGLPAGFFGGKIDDVLMRIAEVFLVMPFLLIIIVLSRVLVLAVGAGLGLWIVIAILGVFGWGGLSRLIRGEVLRVREMEFIQAEKCLGARSRRILFRHLFPNVLSPIIVYGTLLIAANILTEAVISFLGFGDPNTVTYGQLLNIGYVNFVREWWTEVLTGITLLIAVVGFNVLGDGLSDALNPRLRE